MTWIAIRTAPGAQMPQREYAVESTTLGKDGRPRGKGYRIVPSLNPSVSAVERALTDEGFAHYMPVERKVIRDRRKTNHWTTRRFPLLRGYVFVSNVVDFRKLEETPGVAGIIGINGKPLHIPAGDIAILRNAELRDAERVERELAELRERAQRLTHSKARSKFPTGSRVQVTKGLIGGDPGRLILATVVTADRDGRLKAIVDGLDALGTISLPISDVALIAAE